MKNKEETILIRSPADKLIPIYIGTRYNNVKGYNRRLCLNHVISCNSPSTRGWNISTLALNAIVRKMLKDFKRGYGGVIGRFVEIKLRGNVCK